MDRPENKRRFFYAVSAVAMAAALLVGAYFIFYPPSRPRDYIVFTGVIEAAEAHLAPGISGRIEWLCCEEGDRVEAGGLAIRLESSQLEARVEAGRHAVAAADEELKEARRALDEARGAGAEAGSIAAKARISSAQASLKQARAQLKVLTSVLSETRIRSPIDGVVAYKAFIPGEFVGAGAPVYTLYGLDSMRVRLDVEAAEMEKLRAGSRVEVRIPASPSRSYKAEVREAGPAPEDGPRGTKPLRVVAAIEGADGLLKPGMTVEVRLYSTGGERE